MIHINSIENSMCINRLKGSFSVPLHLIACSFNTAIVPCSSVSLVRTLPDTVFLFTQGYRNDHEGQTIFHPMQEISSSQILLVLQRACFLTWQPGLLDNPATFTEIIFASLFSFILCRRLWI